MTKSRSVVPEQIPHRLGQSRGRIQIAARRTQAVQRAGQAVPFRLGERGRRPPAEKADGPGAGDRGPGDLRGDLAGEREEGLGGDGQVPADALDGVPAGGGMWSFSTLLM